MRKRQIGAASSKRQISVSRRGFIVGGTVAGSLAIAWTLWPRSYIPDVALAPGEQMIDAFLKIDRTGQIIVIVPQSEMGQGDYTILPQILADELGADWRTVAVQPAVPGPLYANTLLARQWLEGTGLRAFHALGDYAVDQYAIRNGLVLTGASTSVPMFEDSYRRAGAAARILLCKAAAAKWDVPWESCDVVKGIVTDGTNSVAIGEVVEQAIGFDLPDQLPMRDDKNDDDRLIGTNAPRLDVPAKIDGSANFAGDIRLPGMVFASIRQGPIGDSILQSMNEGAARKVGGVRDIVRAPDNRWVAVTGTNWWAANQGLDRLDPVFRVNGPLLHDGMMTSAMRAAIAGDEGERFFARGDLAPIFDKARIVGATYKVAPALHLSLEPLVATARVNDGSAEIWLPSQAPGLARRAVAHAIGIPETAVTIYPMFAGGSFGRKMEVDAAVQAAQIAQKVGAPVQLQYSRSEDIISDRPRAPAIAHLTAKLGRGGLIEGLSAKVGTPAALAQTWRRNGMGEAPHAASRATATTADRNAVSGMDTPYAIANYAVDHLPCEVGLPTGWYRANADGYGAFFIESFVDELAAFAGVEPMSFRIQMLGGNPRLAHCLTTVAAIGEWQGGASGSGQGIACHSMGGSHIAVLVKATLDNGAIRVERIVAAVDCGSPINPDIVRQQVEGGLIFGLACAVGSAGRYKGGLPRDMRLGGLKVPRMKDCGEVTVELIANTQPGTGYGEIGVPAVAPALAGALYTLTGRRWRDLPFLHTNQQA